VRRIAGQLPSRAADNLFWLGRYLERAEATLRVLRAFGRSLSEADAFAAGPGRQSERLQRLLVAWGAVKTVSPAQPRQVATDAFRDHRHPGSVAAVVESARRAAAALRERLSPDVWHLLASLSTDAGTTAPSPAEIGASAEGLLRTLAAISGLASENMNRLAGWRFLDMGRRIERAINTSRLTRHFAPQDAAAGDLDILLDLADSQITYRSRYLSGPCLAPVRDLILLDPHNPRSVAFQVEALADHFAHLPQLREDGLPERPRRLVLGLSAELATAEPGDADATTLLAWEQDLMALADAIGARYFPHGPDAVRPEKLAGLA
jgi:uncharacterized alpha-E superfamily protein